MERISKNYMDFLTIDLIKTHCRIEGYSEDPDEQRKIDKTIKKCANPFKMILKPYKKEQ